jgi:hypothetical protein
MPIASSTLVITLILFLFFSFLFTPTFFFPPIPTFRLFTFSCFFTNLDIFKMSSRAPSPAQLQSTLLHAQALQGHSSAHLEMLLFRYIETLPINHAMRVVGRWPEDSAPGVYAASVLGALPANYFQQPRLLPVGPRFVFMNGVLTLARIDEALPMQQLHPDSTTGCVGTSILDVLPSPMSQRRLRPLNSFMIFRSKHHPFLSSFDIF